MKHGSDWYQRDPQAYLGGVQGMTMRQHAVYSVVIDLIYAHGGSVNNDPGWISGWIKDMGASAVRNAIAELCAMPNKLVIEGDQITQNRAKNQAKTREKLRETARETGKKGGKKSAELRAAERENKHLAQAVASTENQPEKIREDKKEGGGGSAHTREADPPSRSEAATAREQILEAMGLDSSGCLGPSAKIVGNMADMAEYRRWRADLGLDHDAIIAVIRETMAGKRDGPPSTFGYFTQPMRRAAAALAPKPTLTPIKGGRRHDDDNQPARASRDPHARALGGMVESWSRVIAAEPGGRGGPDDGG